MSNTQHAPFASPYSYSPPGAIVTPNNLPCQIISEGGTDFYTVKAPAAGTFDAGAAPMTLTTIYPGLLAKIVNAQATDFVVKGTKVGDPGVLCLAGTTTVVTDDGNGNLMEVSNSGSGSSGTGPLFTSALAKGQVDANVPNLAAFTCSGAGRDGITYAQGDLVVLNKQTTVAQNGPYFVGAVVANVAPLTRPSWWAPGSAIPSGFEFELSNLGTDYGGLRLLVTTSGAKVVDTDDPVLLFRSVCAQIAGAGATYTRAKGFASATPITHPGAGDWTMTGGAAGVDFTKMTLGFFIDQANAQASFPLAVGSLTATALRVQAFLAAVQSDVNFFVECNLIP